MDSDVSPELSGVSPFADSGERAAHPDHTELDEETLTALRLFAAEGMLAAVGAQLREPIGGAVRPG
ncbi:hypothetical protein [Embleya sp. NPDC059259]|uniref:hypothetical protein n=1 Tax=unclassified Embleya TaxID=2699296 RepID=UPI0036AB2686